MDHNGTYLLSWSEETFAVDDQQNILVSLKAMLHGEIFLAMQFYS
jgi:hypothetical protein